MKKKILKTAGCLTSAEEFKFLEDSEMKTKSKLLTGAVAGLSFLALAATGTWAADVYCESGTVVGAGSGYAFPIAATPAAAAVATATSPYFVSAADRTCTLICGTPSSPVSPVPAGLATWDGSARTFLIPATPDKDGVYAACLTALADDKPVEFWLSNGALALTSTVLTPTDVSYRKTGTTTNYKATIKLLNVVGP